MTKANEQAHGVEQAFLGLEQAPPVLQSLLRPVLIRALQDPVIMRLLGSTALSQHLAVLGQVLTGPTSDRADSALPPLKSFVQLAVGEDVEDVEDAYEFVRGLDAPQRARVEACLSQVLQNAATRTGQGMLSLLAFARLCALAYSNLPYMEHVLAGGAVEPFLPVQTTKKPRKQARAASVVHTGSAQAARVASPELASFVGQIVELVATVDEDEETRAGHVFVTIGRVLEVTAGHVILETQPGDAEQGQGSKLLIGMAHIVTMRTLSEDSLGRTSQTG